MTLRAAMSIVGALASVALVAAAGFLISGDSLAALKLLLFVLLTPGLALFVGWTWWIVHRPKWYLRPERIEAAAFLGGCVMVIAPLLIYLPWAPARFGIDEMPLPLAVVMTAGVLLAWGGAFAALVTRTYQGWQARDVGVLIAGIAVLGFMIFLAVQIVVARIDAG